MESALKVPKESCDSRIMWSCLHDINHSSRPREAASKIFRFEYESISAFQAYRERENSDSSNEGNDPFHSHYTVWLMFQSVIVFDTSSFSISSFFRDPHAHIIFT